MLGKAIGLFFIILVAGFGYYGYQLYTAAEGIEVTSVSVSSLNLGNGLIPSKISLELDIKVKNPSSTTVQLDRLSYNIYINDKFAAEGTKAFIEIPANRETPIRIPVDIVISDVLNLVGSLIMEGKRTIQIDIVGTVDVPILLFGSIRTISIYVPFEESQTYELPIPELPKLPIFPQPSAGKKSTSLVLDSPPSAVSEGTLITFTGRLILPENIFILADVIRLYDDDLIGDDLMASGSIEQDGSFSITWTAKTMDTWPDKTVEVYAKFEGTDELQSSISQKYTIEIR